MNNRVVMGTLLIGMVVGLILLGVVITGGLSGDSEKALETYQHNQAAYASISKEKQHLEEKGTSAPEAESAAGGETVENPPQTEPEGDGLTPEGLPEGDRLVGIYGTDERSTETSRSDIIIVARYLSESGKVVMVSIPRDTRVTIPGRGLDKINHAFAFGGPELLSATIEALMGLPLNHYIRMNFEDFKDIIDEMGGVTVAAAKDFSNTGGTIKIPAGTQTLSGEEGLFYVRYRSDSQGDFGRIKRQQEVIESLAMKVLDGDRLTTGKQLSTIYTNYLETNIALDMVLGELYGADTETVTFEAITLKTTSKIIDGIWYEIYDEASLQDVIEKLTE